MAVTRYFPGDFVGTSSPASMTWCVPSDPLIKALQLRQVDMNLTSAPGFIIKSGIYAPFLGDLERKKRSRD
jgi:hypothetical protein